jgi:hypothetical protein
MTLAAIPSGADTSSRSFYNEAREGSNDFISQAADD